MNFRMKSLREETNFFPQAFILYADFILSAGCAVIFPVVFCLRFPQLPVFSCIYGEQLCVAAALNQTALFKDGNIVAETAGSKAMADVNRRPARKYGVKFRINRVFGNWIERSRRFIQNDKGRIPVKRAGQCDFLGFASGDFHPFVFKIPI